MYLTNFDNRIDFKNIVNRHLKQKDTDVCDRPFNLKNSIENLTNINNRINILIPQYQPNKYIELGGKKKSC